MIVELKDLILFVTAFVSFLHGTRMAWSCGRSCNSKKTPKERFAKMEELIPISTLVYLFGFAITSNYLYKLVLGVNPEEVGTMAIIAMSLINAFLTSIAIAWLAMPKSRRLF